MANGTLSYSQFSTLVQQYGFSSSEKTKFVDFIDKYFKYDLRTFAFSAAGTVSATAPADCRVTFARTFDHLDWRDGEDLVAAGGVQGFNVRFNALKSDLDTIKADIEHAFQCLAGLRASVAAALGELKDQVNLLNKDVYECCNSHVDATLNPPPATIPPRLRELVEMPELPVKPKPGDPAPWLKFADKVWINAQDPNEGIIKGVQGKRIDTMTLHGKPMDVWSTDAGLVLSDSIPGMTAAPPSYTAPQVADITRFTRYVAEKKGDVEAAFDQGFTAKEFVEKFGNDTLPDGMKVSEVLKDVPAEIRFENVDALQDRVIEAKVSNMVTEGSGDVALIGAIGMQTDAKPEDVSVSSIKTLDRSVSEALDQAGIRTIGDIARADRQALTQALGGRAGDAGALIGLSRTVTRLGGRVG
ncbi:MAG: hypothetical protein JSS07_12330 [Proteobacteria bacterium]|nr:hypothetical protein [Pseudomonadota bacterium]